MGDLCALKSMFPDDPDAEYPSIEATVLEKLGLAEQGGDGGGLGGGGGGGLGGGGVVPGGAANGGFGFCDDGGFLYGGAGGFGGGGAASNPAPAPLFAQFGAETSQGPDGAREQRALMQARACASQQASQSSVHSGAGSAAKRQRVVETIDSYVESGGYGA